MGRKVRNSDTGANNTMKIAITGASGFIGRHLLPLLIQNGHEVIAVVRDAKKVADLNINCRIVEYEINNESADAFTAFDKPDALLHLAWGGLPDYKSSHHIDTELPMHYKFIKLMIESGLKQVAVIGTCFEYGMQSGELCEELETRANNSYGYAKDALRKQLQFLQSEHNFNLTWMRLFYVYGEDQPDNTLYSQLRLAASRREAIFNMSSGEQLRDYLHINDVVQKIAKLVCMNKNVGIVNVCSGIPISVRRLVERWIKENEWSIKLNLGYYPYPDYEPLAFWGKSNKLNEIIKLGI